MKILEKPINDSDFVPARYYTNMGLSQNSSTTFFRLFQRGMWIVLSLSAILQCLFFWSSENIFAVVCVLFAWKLTDIFIFRLYNINNFTLSSFMIIGFSLTQYCLPLIFTLVEGKPIVYNLDFPYDVFTHSLLALIVLILSHYIYKYWNGIKSRPYQSIQRILKNYKFFSAPTNLQIWIMGFIGLFGMVFTFLTDNLYNVSDDERGGLAKFMQGLIPFSYAPFFILLRPLFSSKQEIKKVPIFNLVLFTLILLIVGVAGNSRGLFMTGVTAAGIAYFLGLLLGKFDYRIFNIKNTTLGLIGLWLATGPLSDIGTAMVVVRAQRGDISNTELLSKTFDAYENKDELRLYKLLNLQTTSEWDEHYFDNIFLARFCNLKFNDASLGKANKIQGIDPLMQQYSIDRLWATLPQPILSLFQINIDKNTIRGSSFGDYLFFRAGGGNAVLGGYRTGQFAGTGMAAFGWWYLLLLSIGIIPVYFLVDQFLLFNKNSTSGAKSPTLSLAGILTITSTFMFVSYSFTSESVISIFTYVIRGWIQLIFLYWLVYYVSRKISTYIKM